MSAACRATAARRPQNRKSKGRLSLSLPHHAKTKEHTQKHPNLSRWPSRQSPLCSKDQLCAELHGTVAARTANETEIWVVYVRVRVIQLPARGVRDAERLCSNFEVPPLGEVELLEQRGIEIRETGPA